jgi:hypothetical protein
MMHIYCQFGVIDELFEPPALVRCLAVTTVLTAESVNTELNIITLIMSPATI